MALDEIPNSLLRAWESRVASGVRVRDAYDARRIAEICAQAEWCGEKHVSVWHEAAAYYGTPCHCRRCEIGGTP